MEAGVPARERQKQITQILMDRSQVGLGHAAGRRSVPCGSGLELDGSVGSENGPVVEICVPGGMKKPISIDNISISQ